MGVTPGSNPPHNAIEEAGRPPAATAGLSCHDRAAPNSERDDRPKPAAPFIPPVWYRARPWDPPITNDAAWL